jgi:hypothetical protein
MGLFSSNKNEKAGKPELPPLKFPDLPQAEPEKKPDISPEEASAIKQAVASIPESPSMMEAAPTEMPMPTAEGERPLFVRVEKYKEVMNTINELKERLKDAGNILTELNRIKDEEEHELNSWQKDLESIKQKLMTIDKTLFES